MNAVTIVPDAPNSTARQAIALAAFAIAYLALAAYAASLPVQARMPYYIWPAHGLALGMLLVSPWRRWPALLGMAFAATAIVALAQGRNAGAAVVAGGLAALLPALVAAGLQRLAGPRVQIDTIKGLAAFLVGMMPLVAVLALLDAAYAWLRFGVALRPQWTLAFATHMLGMLLTAPVLLAWTRHGWHEAVALGRSRMAEMAAMYAGLVVTTHFVFTARGDALGTLPPLLYLCAPFAIWAALRFGLRAATVALALFGLIGYWHTGHGHGPFALNGLPDARSLLHLQAYLATIVVTTLFSAALLVERQEAGRQTEGWRRRHERVIRASQSLVYEIDPRGAVVWDGDTRGVLGVEATQVDTTRKWMARVHPEDRPRLQATRRQLQAGEISHVAVEYRFRREDGEYITLGVNGYLVGDAHAGRHVTGFVKDVSDKVRAEEERRRLEAQLKQAEKMQAVGHLAGGIAHDFNNILGAILGYGELAQQKARDPDVVRYVDTIMDAGNRAKSLVTQILSYSRAEGTAKAPVIVAPIAQEACDLVRGSSGASIEVRFVDEAGEAAVLGDPTRLHQLLMNLCTNAVQAMVDGGTLEVAVALERLTAPRKVRTGEVPAGEYVRLSVRDSGHGIAPEVIDRIFEPFFTTKPAGRGTGLGLALVHSVTVEHQGFLEVTSELGRGTAFVVWMPRLRGVAGAPDAPRDELPRGQGQVILAVDDEPEVLAALEEMLATLGYEPCGFRNGREALAAARAAPRRFEAVVSDEVMPLLTGTQLAIELRKLDPGLPILIASGYGGSGFETRALSAGVNRVIKKPYRMSEIAEVLATFFASK